MTAQEAIEILRDTPIDIRSTREDDIHTLYATALNMAIEALSTSQNLSEPNNDLEGYDLISRADIEWHDYLVDYLVADGNGMYHEEKIAYKSQIDMLPSAQPEIIRCKDCKHSAHWYRDKARCFLWHVEGIDVFEDGFCNYAERRTDETD